MSDKNKFQNLFDFDGNNSVPSSKNDGDYQIGLIGMYKPVTFEACISDYESSNKDNLDQNYSSKLHW